jgi:hypothetical protein
VLLPLTFVAAGVVIATELVDLARSQSSWHATARRALSEGRAAQGAIREVSVALKSLPDEPIWTRFYSVGSAAGNQEALLADVSQALGQSGIVGSKVTAEPTFEANGLISWRCRVAFQANAEQLHAVSTRLRSLPRYVRLSELTISAPQLQGSADNPTFEVGMMAEGFSASSKVTIKSGKS